MTEKKEYISSVGRRKRAIARVRLYTLGENKGSITINGKPADEYFKSMVNAKSSIAEVFHCTNTSTKFVTTILVEGSGISGQLGAVTLGIARALVKFDPKHKAILRKKGYMTRVPKEVERKKPGLPKAR
ncbi:MAG: 30S ribosomal protein S9, partial [bacterium]|nr:30S ribosomal protein S9 [bacterium]